MRGPGVAVTRKSGPLILVSGFQMIRLRAAMKEW